MSALVAAAALAALPALSAPSNPRVVGTATQASGSDPSVLVTTTGVIHGGDVIMVIAASELNMTPLGVNCAGCAVSGVQLLGNGSEWPAYYPIGKAGQADSKVIAAYARQDLPAGSQFQVMFGGGAGAKAVTIVAISGASQIGVQPTYSAGGSAGNYGTGVGAAVGWGCATNCSIAANLMMVSASTISGGGGDSYTEDAAWTFLHQSAAGAWPAIRIAYRSSGPGGTFSYGLTSGTSRSWVSGALLVR